MSTSTLALYGGVSVRNADKEWPQWPLYDEQEKKALLEVLDSGKWFFGERVAAFEKAYAAFQEAEYCITCNSGTAAGEIILQVHWASAQVMRLLFLPIPLSPLPVLYCALARHRCLWTLDDTWGTEPGFN